MPADIITTIIPYRGSDIEKIHIKGTVHSYWIYRVTLGTFNVRDFLTQKDAEEFIDQLNKVKEL